MPAFQLFGSRQQHAQGCRIEPVQDQNLRPAEQSGVEREAGVLGRGADQGHCAFLDKGQEAILLCAVEAMDLVHKQQRALSHFRRNVGLGKGLLEIGDAREHRADRGKAHADAIG